MELAFTLTALRRAWWLLLLTILLGVGTGMAANRLSTVTHRSTVQQFVSFSDDTDPTTSNILNGSQFTLQRVKSYTEVATSSQVLGPVISQLGLRLTAEQLADRIEVTNPLDTVLLEISATDPDPHRAAAIANAVGAQLNRVVENIERPEQGGPSPVKITVTEPAIPAASPDSPRVGLNLAFGLLAGLALGMGGALAWARLDTRIRHRRDLQALTGASPLGVVPFDPAARQRPLVSADPGGPRAEAFRSLRTNLHFVDVDRPPRSFVVTSPLPGEGKSTTSCNIALTLAQAGARVVLVDGDLRKPRASTYLGLDGAAGLTDVLTRQRGIHEVLVELEGGRMAVLPAGPLPPNPSELLGSRQMISLLATLENTYDLVVIDAAPLLPVTDAAVIASAADGALLLVRHGRTRREEIEQGLQALSAANARLLGTVLTFAPHGRRHGDRGYGHGYGGYEDRGAASRTAPGPHPAATQVPPRRSASTAASTATVFGGSPEPKAPVDVRSPADAPPSARRPRSS